MKKLILLFVCFSMLCIKAFALGDLIITTATASPRPITSSSSVVNLSFTCKNQGDITAAFSGDLWLSTNNTIGTGDIKVADLSIGPLTIAPGASQSGSAAGISMSGYTSGPYYLILRLDPGHFVDEGSAGEANNIFVIDLKSSGGTGGSKPDLSVEWAELSETGFRVGDSTNARIIISNHASVNANRSFAIAYLTKNIRWTTSSGLSSIGSIIVDTLKPNTNSDTLEFKVKIPNTFSRGLAYIHIVADGSRNISESDENNNEKTIPVTVYQNEASQLADIEITFSEPSRNTTLTKDTLSVRIGLRNNGSIKTDSIHISARYCKDTMSGIYFGGTETFKLAPLEPGASYSDILVINVPDLESDMLAYLSLTADLNNAVEETNKLNNTLSKRIDFLLNTTANLIIDAYTYNEKVTLGERMPLNVSIYNSGGKTAPASVVKLYASEDMFLNATDMLVGSVNVPQIQGQSSMSVDDTIVIPFTLSPFTTTIFFAADANNNVTESNEHDNLAAASFAVNKGKSFGSINVTSNMQNEGTWQIVGFSNVFNFNTKIENVPVGAHTLKFNAIPGYKTPSNVNINVQGGLTTEINVTYELATALDEKLSRVIKSAYPNPASDHFFIELVDAASQIKVFDLSGKEVISNFDANTSSLEISHLSKGIYFVHVITPEYSGVIKLVKE